MAQTDMLGPNNKVISGGIVASAGMLITVKKMLREAQEENKKLKSHNSLLKNKVKSANLDLTLQENFDLKRDLEKALENVHKLELKVKKGEKAAQ